MARSGCLYAPTGCLKTSQVKWFSHYIAETTGKSTLLLSTDGGGWEPCEPEVRAGMIRPYRVEMATIPLPILRNISRGYWPKDVEETDPERIQLVPINWAEVGAVAVEGWTSIGNVVLRFLPDSGISVGGEDRNKLGGFSQPVNVNGKLETGHFRSTTRGDYGFVQNFLYGLVMNFNALPCRYVLYTALESKAEDDDRVTTFGPSIAGKKATAQCGSWVGDLLHGQDYTMTRTEKVPSPDGGGTIDSIVRDVTVRYYFKPHLDPVTSIPFPCKPRVTPEKVSALVKRFPGGYFEPKVDGTDSFADYLRELDKLASEQADTLAGWREQAAARLRGPAAAAKVSTGAAAEGAVASTKS